MALHTLYTRDFSLVYLKFWRSNHRIIIHPVTMMLMLMASFVLCQFSSAGVTEQPLAVTSCRLRNTAVQHPTTLRSWAKKGPCKKLPMKNSLTDSWSKAVFKEQRAVPVRLHLQPTDFREICFRENTLFCSFQFRITEKSSKYRHYVVHCILIFCYLNDVCWVGYDVPDQLKTQRKTLQKAKMLHSTTDCLPL